MYAISFAKFLALAIRPSINNLFYIPEMSTQKIATKISIATLYIYNICNWWFTSLFLRWQMKNRLKINNLNIKSN